MKKLVKISYITYIFFILMIISGYIRYLIYLLFIFFIHEIGHVIAFYICHIKINSINIYPFGGVINSDLLLNTSSLKILFISSGGIIFQLGLFLIIKDPLLWQINKSIILLNILPIVPLDGNKIVMSIFECISPYSITIRGIMIISTVALLNSLITSNNYLLFIVLLYFNIKNIYKYKYIMNKFYLERYLYKFKHKRIKVIKNISKMYKNYNNFLINNNLIFEETEYLYQSIDKT